MLDARFGRSLNEDPTNTQAKTGDFKADFREAGLKAERAGSPNLS
jgi:hypothetical protein